MTTPTTAPPTGWRDRADARIGRCPACDEYTWRGRCPGCEQRRYDAEQDEPRRRTEKANP